MGLRGFVGSRGNTGPLSIIGTIIPSNVVPFRKVPGDLYAIAATPQNYELNFDNTVAFNYVEITSNSNISIPPASVTLIDETGSGGKKFFRIIATTLTSFQHSVIRLKGSFGDGYHRVLFRISGTEPSTSQSHGIALHNRFSIDTGANSGGTSYSLGHFIRTGTTQRIRELVAGSSTVISSNTNALPFNHNEWAWAELYINGTTIEGRYWKESDSRPASPSLSATDSTLSESDGDSGISMLGRNTTNGDVAKYVFIPIGGVV
jgi:hypothetical protein